MSYLVFVLGNPRFLAFGFLLTWFSSFGHTFVIALFGADIRAEFGLSHGGFGLVYSLATRGSRSTPGSPAWGVTSSASAAGR